MGKRSAVKSTRSTRSRTPLIVGILVVGVLALVIGGTLLDRGDDADASGGSSTVGPIPITRAAVQFPTSVVAGVVVAGAPGKTGKTGKTGKGKSAPHTLDLYEDAQCPACQALESRGGARLA